MAHETAESTGKKEPKEEDERKERPQGKNQGLCGCLFSNILRRFRFPDAGMVSVALDFLSLSLSLSLAFLSLSLSLSLCV